MQRRKFSLILLFIITVATQGMLSAQPLQLGQAIVTKGPTPANPYFIEVLDTRNVSGAPLGTDWNVTKFNNSDWGSTSDLGQIFGIAIDDNAPPNIFVTATNLYSMYAGGSAGFGAIYKVNGSTWNISTITTTLNSPAASTIGTNQIPNTAGTGSLGSNSGLGNICYDKWNKQLFVTNREDGKIYRLNPGGTVLSIYDPLNPDDGLAGLCLENERPWGIGISKDSRGILKVFYAVNYGNTGTGGNALNKIWSVSISNTGDFISGSELHETDIEALASNIEISDIEFSSNGNLLLAERDLYTGLFPASLHLSRVMYLQGTSQAWTAPRVYYVGNYSIGANSAGGCDFGYGSSLLDDEILSGCDSLVWTSGNVLAYPLYVYGIAGIPVSGNSISPFDPDYVGSTSIYVDYDEYLTTDEKGDFGDVDIYRESCPDYESLCDLISIEYNAVDGEENTCCWQINATNNYDENYFTALQIIAGDGVNLNYVGGSGIGSFNATSATVLPPDGSSFIPKGTFENFLTVCLNNFNTDEQFVILNWMGPGGPDGISVAVCSDTLFFNCSTPPPVSTCTNVFYDTVFCTGDSIVYQFQITNSATNNFNVAAFNLLFNDLTDILIPIPYFVLDHPLLPGETSKIFSFDLSGYGVDAGRELCFSIVAHNDVMTETTIPTICCTDTLALNCFTIPDCNICCDTCCDAGSLVIPTGITPNSDGVNDRYILSGINKTCMINIKVYNRWGNIVFTNNNYLNTWAGENMQGERLPQGTYFIVLQLSNGSKKESYIDIRY